MKFTIATLVALVAAASAYSFQEHDEFIKRQANVQNSVDPSAPAMSNANGDVVPFNTQDVYLDSVAKGI